jgi:hypothetical protein
MKPTKRETAKASIVGGQSSILNASLHLPPPSPLKPLFIRQTWYQDLPDDITAPTKEIYARHSRPRRPGRTSRPTRCGESEKEEEREKLRPNVEQRALLSSCLTSRSQTEGLIGFRLQPSIMLLGIDPILCGTIHNSFAISCTTPHAPAFNTYSSPLSSLPFRLRTFQTPSFGDRLPPFTSTPAVPFLVYVRP